MGICFSCRNSKASHLKDKKQKLCGHLPANKPAFATTNEELLPGNGHVPTIVANGSPQMNGRRNSSMANSFSNMNFTNSIKGLVSKRRNRYKKDGFNLDLTYITDRVIAMGYPASKIEGVYRNHIDDVVNFLETKHHDHYKIYNLCSERSYDISKFHNRVETFPFDDHNPPKIELIEPFCNSVHQWLRQNEKNVAVVHCKAGKGRTGTMICCYLLHSRQFVQAEDALNFYGQTRTQDRKGVTIPSQKRYVNYYAKVINDKLQYNPVALYIKEIQLEPVPSFTQGALCFSISSQQNIKSCGGEDSYQKCSKLYKSSGYDVKKSSSNFTIKMDCCLPLSGDIKIEVYNKTKLRKEKQLQFWFNTFFVCDELADCDSTTNNGGLIDNGSSYNRSGAGEERTLVLRLKRSELDIVNKKDKQNKVFSSDFQVTILMNQVPTKASNWYLPAREPPTLPPDTPSESSEAETSEDDTNEEDDWDSVERDTLDPRGVGYRLLSECEIASQLTSSSNDQQPELLTA